MTAVALERVGVKLLGAWMAAQGFLQAGNMSASHLNSGFVVDEALIMNLMWPTVSSVVGVGMVVYERGIRSRLFVTGQPRPLGLSGPVSARHEACIVAVSLFGLWLLASAMSSFLVSVGGFALSTDDVGGLGYGLLLPASFTNAAVGLVLSRKAREISHRFV